MNRFGSKHRYNRRKFLRMALGLGGLTVAAPLLEACGQIVRTTPAPIPTPNPTAKPNPTATPDPTVTPKPTATPSPTAIPAEEMARVAFVRTTDRAAGVRRAIELLGINPVQGKQVLLKPNFNSDDPCPGSTHPDTLRTLVEELWAMGARSITVGDRSGMGDCRSIMRDLGVLEMAEELEFGTTDFDKLAEAKDWVWIRLPESHWKRGIPMARPCLEAETLVQTCCLKTHQFGGHFTMSLKNSVGMVAKYAPPNDYAAMDELHNSARMRSMIAEINAAYTPALIVLDGVLAFRHGGPHEGTLASSEVVLAGTDRIAIDAVGVALLRYFGTTAAVARGPIFEQEQIARAVELGLGVDMPERIQFVTGDPDSEAYAAEIRQVLLQR